MGEVGGLGLFTHQVHPCMTLHAKINEAAIPPLPLHCFALRTGRARRGLGNAPASREPQRVASRGTLRRAGLCGVV